MAATGKSLRFDPQTVDELANSGYGRADTFALLSIIYAGVDPAKTYHIDHIFPRDKLRRATTEAARHASSTRPTHRRSRRSSP
jgi:hypothetical protein